MKTSYISRIAVALAATILVSLSLCSCEGRRMSNMQPDGDTVEVNPGADLQPEADSLPTDSIETDI